MPENPPDLERCSRDGTATHGRACKASRAVTTVAHHMLKINTLEGCPEFRTSLCCVDRPFRADLNKQTAVSSSFSPWTTGRSRCQWLPSRTDFVDV